MAFLKIKNRAISSLASGVSDSDTSWTLATGEGALFPSSGDFHVTCEDEIAKCTSRSTDVLTVVRAQEGTGAAAHTSGKAVKLQITAGVIDQIETDFLARKLDDLAAPDDNTDLDASASKHGLMPKTDKVKLDAIGGGVNVYQATLQVIPTGAYTHILFETEVTDDNGEFDSSVVTGAADSTVSDKLHDTGAFTEAEAYYVGRTVWNTTDNTYALVTGKDSNDQLALDADIMADTEGYKLFFSRYVADGDGWRIMTITGTLVNLGDGKKIIVTGYKNGSGVVYARTTVGGTDYVGQSAAKAIYMTDGQTLVMKIYHNHGSNLNTGPGLHSVTMSVYKVS